AGVAGAVPVAVFLTGIGDVGAVVARIAPPVVIAVGLGRVGEARAVVVDVQPQVPVRVEHLRDAGDRNRARLPRGGEADGPVAAAVGPRNQVIEDDAARRVLRLVEPVAGDLR